MNVVPHAEIILFGAGDPGKSNIYRSNESVGVAQMRRLSSLCVCHSKN